jgi:hypothetical protein
VNSLIVSLWKKTHGDFIPVPTKFLNLFVIFHMKIIMTVQNVLMPKTVVLLNLLLMPNGTISTLLMEVISILKITSTLNISKLSLLIVTSTMMESLKNVNFGNVTTMLKTITEKPTVQDLELFNVNVHILNNCVKVLELVMKLNMMLNSHS